MSAKVDVLQELKELRDDHMRAGDYSGECNYFYDHKTEQEVSQDWERVIAAIAELIAADREYDRAKNARVSAPTDYGRLTRDEYLAAVSRRAAALAAVTGEAQG